MNHMSHHGWDVSLDPHTVPVFLWLQWAHRRSLQPMQPTLARHALSSAEFDLLATLRNGVELIDCQQNTRHLASLGAREIPRTQFLHTIAHAQHAPCSGWTFDPLYWNALLPPAQAMATPA